LAAFYSDRSCPLTFDGDYDLLQSDTIITVYLTLSGNTVTGSATFPGGIGTVKNGAVSNQGKTIMIDIDWDAAVGHYALNIDSSGAFLSVWTFHGNLVQPLSTDHRFCQ
jgi:hypothetical protein